MIQWLTIAQLEEALAGVPPIGLALRGFFHGRVSANLSAVFERAPETAHMEDVGDVEIWAGAIDQTPFTVTGHRRGELTSFQIALPIAIQDGQLDIRMLYVVESLSPLFHAARNPLVESLPFVGGGFGVVPRGSDDPVFRSPRRADAETVATYLDDPARYEVAILRRRAGSSRVRASARRSRASTSSTPAGPPTSWRPRGRPSTTTRSTCSRASSPREQRTPRTDAQHSVRSYFRVDAG